MKSLKVKNILEGAENEMEDERKQQISDIEEALLEKKIREIQNLELQLEKDRLCAEMRQVDAINDILNSTSKNKTGCPQYPQVEEEVECKECNKKKDEPEVEAPVCCPRQVKMPKFNKKKIYLTFMWVILIILAVGWSPSGTVFTQINESYVNLIVDFFKMFLFALAGFFTYKTIKEDE